MSDTQHTPGPWTLSAGRHITTSSGVFYLSYGYEEGSGRSLFRDFCELDANARKLIVFAWHREVIEKAMIGLASFRPVCIVGGTSDEDREDAIDKFQNDPMTRIFIGNIKAAGTVITLTAASDVVFLESSWTPNENYQAACRAHRIGQKDGVLARVLCLEHSVDAIIQRVLVRKQNELVTLFG